MLNFFNLVLLLIDAAGHSHGAPILSDDGQVSRPMILRVKVFRPIETLWVRGVICDLTADVISKVV